MRVALVFHGCHKRGGVERSIWEAARIWRDEHDVTVIAADIDDTGLDGVTLRRVPVGQVGPWRFGRAARRCYSVEEFDHVISYGVQPVPATVAWVGSVHRSWLESSRRFTGNTGLQRYPRLRYVLPRHQERLQLERWYFGRPRARIVVVADAVGRDLTRLYGVDPAVLRTVHNGFDPAEFDPTRRVAERDDARAQWGLPTDAVVLCIVVNELGRKGYGVLLRAVAQCADPRLHVLLAGTAAPTRYAQLTRELGLDDRVHYIGPQADVGRVHAASDAFVMPTKYEAFCLAVIEALASGLPVVTTDVPGAGDMIEHARNGLLQRDPDDVGELAGLLEQLADDAYRARLAAAARPSVEALSWRQLYESAINDLSTVTG